MTEHTTADAAHEPSVAKKAPAKAEGPSPAEERRVARAEAAAQAEADAARGYTARPLRDGTIVYETETGFTTFSEEVAAAQVAHVRLMRNNYIG